VAAAADLDTHTHACNRKQQTATDCIIDTHVRTAEPAAAAAAAADLEKAGKYNLQK